MTPTPRDRSVERARALIGLSRHDDAVPILESALASDPDDAEVLALLAVAVVPGDARRAHELATAAVAADPDAVWIRAVAADVAIDADESEAAVSQPDHPTARSNLAAIDAHLGKMTSAIDMLQSILQLDPRHEHARRQLDDVVVRLNQELLWAGLLIGLMVAAVIAGVTALVG